ncbi:YeeE/YedE family protein [Chitinophaga sp. Mgbs1]|uniref:YeeE/YedE family protein n=1 Tax=Chitinophaga solisilvae TaxID=1233460 RepID=A0A3S1CRN7_9BACT|nr:YeeE/YedE family protein [Chitinophaga solisilvae]
MLKYLLAGTAFGIILYKAELISWFRIQEMFRLQSFHLYGIIGSAVLVAMAGVWLMKKFRMKSIDGTVISTAPKQFSRGQIYGGLLFGFGWAAIGACPGPLFAQVGAGAGVVLVTIAFAVAGTWLYGKWKHRLPH